MGKRAKTCPRCESENRHETGGNPVEVECRDCGFKFTLRFHEKPRSAWGRGEFDPVDGIYGDLQIVLAPVRYDAAREPERRCAEMVVRSMRTTSKVGGVGFSSAAQWFALAARERP